MLFRSAELKLMVALIIMKYDVKLEGPHPEPMWIVTTSLPDPNAEVSFRRRAVSRD